MVVLTYFGSFPHLSPLPWLIIVCLSTFRYVSILPFLPLANTYFEVSANSLMENQNKQQKRERKNRGRLGDIKNVNFNWSCCFLPLTPCWMLQPSAATVLVAASHATSLRWYSGCIHWVGRQKHNTFVGLCPFFSLSIPQEQLETTAQDTDIGTRLLCLLLF